MHYFHAVRSIRVTNYYAEMPSLICPLCSIQNQVHSIQVRMSTSGPWMVPGALLTYRRTLTQQLQDSQDAALATAAVGLQRVVEYLAAVSGVAL